MMETINVIIDFLHIILKKWINENFIEFNRKLNLIRLRR